MAINPQKQAAKKFVEYWTFYRPGSEKSGCQQYWNMLLGEVLGLPDLASGIRYEVPVKLPTANHQQPTTICDAANVFIQNRGGVLYTWLPKMSKGSQPTDGRNLILSPAEREEIILSHPEAAAFILQYISAEDFINKLRYCLWLKGVAPNLYRAIPEVKERLEAVAEMRRKSPTKSVQRDAETPMLFTQIRQPTTNYLVVPEVSSERRRYVPIGFVQPNVIASNMLYIVPDASLFMFGVLISSVHMAWMRTVCGRLEMRYRYTPAVYNNFPWPDGVGAECRTPHANSEQDLQGCKCCSEIEKTAQGILDARALYPGSSLADLYDPLTMPPELRKAHAANDETVMKTYGFPPDLSEPEVVSHLFDMYAKLTAGDVSGARSGVSSIVR